MKTKLVSIVLLVQACLPAAFADDDYAYFTAYSTTGTLTVNQAFTVKRTRKEEKQPIIKEQLNFSPGTYKLNFESYSETDYSFCLPPLLYCTHSAHAVPVLELTILDKAGSPKAATVFAAPDRSVKGYAVAYYAKDTRQNINIFQQNDYTTQSVNQRTIQQECSVEMYCRDGGSLFEYGNRCTSAVGTQSAQVHDVVTTHLMQLKFTNLQNQVIATYKGSRSSTEEAVVDSTGKCNLNINNH